LDEQNLDSTPADDLNESESEDGDEISQRIDMGQYESSQKNNLNDGSSSSVDDEYSNLNPSAQVEP
jgi:hypothetical protein